MTYKDMLKEMELRNFDSTIESLTDLIDADSIKVTKVNYWTMDKSFLNTDIYLFTDKVVHQVSINTQTEYNKLMISTRRLKDITKIDHEYVHNIESKLMIYFDELTAEKEPSIIFDSKSAHQRVQKSYRSENIELYHFLFEKI
ncbi:hypothetical protein [Alkalicoccus luteus]|uniref:Uncharacterized protein n=1 Tax=Alkalicoccus luteus TaxID=1237094 RepID=A0A969TVE2_9BACI|nr:hypothetical protein [Alkalicoccus luteus]NJP37911.1 hypothetical protein [Alkalicoccus luteus]